MRHKTWVGCVGLALLISIGGCGNSGSTGESTPAGGADASSSKTSSGSSTAQQAKAPAPKPIVVEAGTVIVVTVDQAINTKTVNPGDHFDVSLAEPVVVGEKQVIPQGAKGVGVVTDAKSAGRVKGGAVLAVSLDSVTVHGKSYPVHSGVVEETGKGRGERTAVGAGGGAAVGAIIGAIAGGGKGAAIGAGAGAGAGTAGAVLTGNREISIPAETKLSFKLTQALEIRPE